MTTRNSSQSFSKRPKGTPAMDRVLSSVNSQPNSENGGAARPLKPPVTVRMFS